MLQPRVAHIATVDLSLRYMLLDQMLSLQASGYEVTGMCAPGPLTREVEQAGIRYLPVPFVRSSALTPLADLKALWHLYRVFKRERFTIVHAHTAKADLFGQIAARLAGVPIVLNTQHGFFFHENMPAHWRRFYITLAKIGARCSDVMLSQNPEDVESAVAEGIIARDKVKYLGNGINLTRFDPAQIDPARLQERRREFGFARGTPVVGFVGRLVRDKGILEFFQAAARVRTKKPEVRFLVVGPMDTAKKDVVTPQTAAEYGVSDVCVFAGHRNDMPEMYALMDIFVLPSYREAFPRTPMEASAMGIPSVVTDVRGCRTAVQHERNGLIVPLHDVEALAQAWLRLLDQPETRARMGREGMRMAREQFDEQAVFNKVKAEYARLLKEKSRVSAEGAEVYQTVGRGQ